MEPTGDTAREVSHFLLFSARTVDVNGFARHMMPAPFQPFPTPRPRRAWRFSRLAPTDPWFFGFWYVGFLLSR